MLNLFKKKPQHPTLKEVRKYTRVVKLEAQIKEVEDKLALLEDARLAFTAILQCDETRIKACEAFREAVNKALDFNATPINQRPFLLFFETTRDRYSSHIDYDSLIVGGLRDSLSSHICTTQGQLKSLNKQLKKVK